MRFFARPRVGSLLLCGNSNKMPEQSIHFEAKLSFSRAICCGNLKDISIKTVKERARSMEGSRVLFFICCFLSNAVLELEELLLPSFKCFVDAAFNNDAELSKHADLRSPGQWFPAARGMQRQIFLHLGPTNSGKTYHALQALQKAKRGMYCAPLRLLALEIYDKLNMLGKPCDLVTGDEVRLCSWGDALHVSSTVEMANLARQVDCAVIDEIQMMADASRGWAWTRAVFGLQANELHLCGEESAEPMLQKIFRSLNEKVTVVKYPRLGPLEVMSTSLG